MPKKMNYSIMSEETQHQKVAIYIRVSTHWQIDKDSLQVQRRELAAYAEMVLGIKDYFVFEDPGYSAKNTDRPDYQNMMARLRSGEFTHLLVWKIDRISRNLLDFASMYAELKSLGITFVSKNEQFDTSTAIGEAMLKIILVFAELERQMTAERVTAVMISRANNGQWNGGRVPYVYDYDKSTKTFSVNPTERRVYERMVELYEQKQSVVAVARYLNEHGISTRAGGEWSTAAVHKCLKNPWYVGDYRYNVHSDGKGSVRRDPDEWVTIENHHEPVIDRDRFDRIQVMLQRNKRGGNIAGRTIAKKHIHIFAGLLRCGECGSNMTATLDKLRVSGWRPSLYGCAIHRRDKSRCQSKYVTDVTLGPFVFNFIANIVRARGRIGERTTTKQLQRTLLTGEAFKGVEAINNDALEELRDMLLSGKDGFEYRPRAITASPSPETVEMENLRKRRQQYETALGRLRSLYLYSDNGMSEKDYIIEKQKIAVDLEAVERRMSELTAAGIGGITDPEEMMDQASYFIMAQKLLSDDYIDYTNYISKVDPAIPRAFIRSVVREIVVTDGEVESIDFQSGIRCIFTR